jgi:hypothetical protein
VVSQRRRRAAGIAERREHEHHLLALEAKVYKLLCTFLYRAPRAWRIVEHQRNGAGASCVATEPGFRGEPVLSRPKSEVLDGRVTAALQIGGYERRQIVTRAPNADGQKRSLPFRPSGAQSLSQSLQIVRGLVEAAEAARESYQLPPESDSQLWQQRGHVSRLSFKVRPDTSLFPGRRFDQCRGNPAGELADTGKPPRCGAVAGCADHARPQHSGHAPGCSSSGCPPWGRNPALQPTRHASQEQWIPVQVVLTDLPHPRRE